MWNKSKSKLVEEWNVPGRKAMKETKLRFNHRLYVYTQGILIQTPYMDDNNNNNNQ